AIAGVQCKNVERLAIQKVTFEIPEAELFTPPLAEYWIVTSADRDASIQAEIRELSRARVAERKFRVGTMFWEDIERELAGHPDLVRKYYGSWADDHERQVQQAATKLLRLANQTAKVDKEPGSVLRGYVLSVSEEIEIEAAYQLKGDK